MISAASAGCISLKEFDIKRNTIEIKEKNERELLLYIKKHHASILKSFIDSKQN